MDDIKLMEEVIRTCPGCDATITLPVGTLEGEIIPCPDCGREWELVFDPSGLKHLVSAEKGTKETDAEARARMEEYNTLLARYQRENARYVLMPPPTEGEDWGE